MKIDRKDGTQQRNVLTGMVVNDVVCGAVAAKWPEPEGLFESRWSNLIGGWSVDYYRKYHRAPGDQMSKIFDRWASAGKKDKDVVNLVEQFLAGLSGDYQRLRKGVQADYLIDVAGAYFTEVQLRKAHAEAAAALEAGNPEKAQELMSQARKVDLAGGSGVNVLEDREAVKRAFARKSDPVITYPGAAGVFFGDVLERDGFVSFEAPEKTGKSWWLMDLAWRGMLQGRKVAMFQIGDMSEAQIMLRLGIRAARRPYDTEPFQYPTGIEPPGEGNKSATPRLADGKCDKILTERTVSKAFARVLRGKTKPKEPLLKLYSCPASSISVSGINSLLSVWEAQSGWIPDVAVIDYADLLAPEAGTADTRDQINQSWKMMRALSSRRHCLVVTATQTDADSYDSEIIEMDNFSEDKRKRAHVTASIGINQRAEEKAAGLYRLNFVVRREHKFDRRTVVHCAGSLALANPCLFSTF